MHTSPSGQEKLVDLIKPACSTAFGVPPTSPEHPRSRFRSVENREETQPAPSYHPDAAPVGMSQDGVADLWLLRRGLTARKKQFVQEVALLEDSRVDAEVVLRFQFRRQNFPTLSQL